jgi:hypothetical protein
VNYGAGVGGYACIIHEATGKVLREFKSEGGHSVTAAELAREIPAPTLETQMKEIKACMNGIKSK